MEDNKSEKYKQKLFQRKTKELLYFLNQLRQRNSEESFGSLRKPQVY